MDIKGYKNLLDNGESCGAFEYSIGKEENESKYVIVYKEIDGKLTAMGIKKV